MIVMMGNVDGDGRGIEPRYTSSSGAPKPVHLDVAVNVRVCLSALDSQQPDSYQAGWLVSQLVSRPSVGLSLFALLLLSACIGTKQTLDPRLSYIGSRVCCCCPVEVVVVVALLKVSIVGGPLWHATGQHRNHCKLGVQANLLRRTNCPRLERGLSQVRGGRMLFVFAFALELVVVMVCQNQLAVNDNKQSSADTGGGRCRCWLGVVAGALA